eukprot:gene5308-6452_t
MTSPITDIKLEDLRESIFTTDAERIQKTFQLMHRRIRQQAENQEQLEAKLKQMQNKVDYMEARSKTSNVDKKTVDTSISEAMEPVDRRLSSLEEKARLAPLQYDALLEEVRQQRDQLRDAVSSDSRMDRMEENHGLLKKADTVECMEGQMEVSDVKADVNQLKQKVEDAGEEPNSAEWAELQSRMDAVEEATNSTDLHAKVAAADALCAFQAASLGLQMASGTAKASPAQEIMTIQSQEALENVTSVSSLALAREKRGLKPMPGAESDEAELNAQAERMRGELTGRLVPKWAASLKDQAAYLTKMKINELEQGTLKTMQTHLERLLTASWAAQMGGEGVDKQELEDLRDDLTTLMDDMTAKMKTEMTNLQAFKVEINEEVDQLGNNLRTDLDREEKKRLEVEQKLRMMAEKFGSVLNKYEVMPPPCDQLRAGPWDWCCGENAFKGENTEEDEDTEIPADETALEKLARKEKERQAAERSARRAEDNAQWEEWQQVLSASKNVETIRTANGVWERHRTLRHEVERLGRDCGNRFEILRTGVMEHVDAKCS